MLRISNRTIEGAGATLHLEGQLIGPWVTELARMCEQFLGNGHRLTLDLGDVSFADREGVAALRDLVSRKAKVINCPLFLAEQLRDPAL